MPSVMQQQKQKQKNESMNESHSVAVFDSSKDDMLSMNSESNVIMAETGESPHH